MRTRRVFAQTVTYFMWLDLRKLSIYWHKKWIPIYCWLLNLHLALPRNTKHITIDGQVCFYWRLIADSVKPPGLVNGINKDMTGVKLLPTTVVTCAVDWVHFCHLLKTQHCCLWPYGRFNPPPATHHAPSTYPTPPTLYNVPFMILQSLWKSFSKTSSVS